MWNHLLGIALILVSSAPTIGIEHDDPTTRPGDKPANEPVELHAGPVRVKFADGELRYVRVGDEEIVRRVYFAVRDGRWDTVMPKFTQRDVNDQHDHFTIHLAAQCTNEKVDYDWTATITGDAAGTITFAAEGTAKRDFASNRIGLCVLYGTPSLSGRSFETLVSADGPAKKGVFSQDVDPELVASDYRIIRFDTAAGVQVTCAGSGSGLFRMEDQRNYGDSSYKAYFPIDYSYPKVLTGSPIAQTVTITVTGATAAATTQPLARATRIRVGEPIAGAKLPQFLPPDSEHKSPGYYSLNFHRAQFADASVLLWNYTPFTHLPDDDVAIENLPTIFDQARTARGFAPHASLHVAPITLDPPSPHPDRLKVRPGTFAAAWSAAFYGNLARAGVSKVTFSVSSPDVDQALKSIEPYAGSQMLQTDIRPGLPLTEQGMSPISAFAAHVGKEDVVWLINLTAQPRDAYFDNPYADRSVRELRINDVSTLSGGLPERSIDRLRSPTVSLEPWEIRRLVFEP